MSALRRTAGQRGWLAEQMVPVAAQLVGAVHDDGPDEVAAILSRVSPGDLDALAVVLAGMVDPDCTPEQLLSWVTWDECGRPLTSAEAQRSYVIPVSDEVRAGHSAYEKARSKGLPIPDHVRELERTYQRVRAQNRQARQVAA